MRKILCLFGILVFMFSTAVFGEDTGWKSDSSTDSATEYFMDAEQPNRYIRCTWLLVQLDYDASGSVAIRRSSSRSAATVNFIDPASTIIIYPGDSYIIYGSNLNAFNFDKTSSVDIIRWIAGRNVDPPDISASRMLTVTVDTILTATTINAVDSLDVELGDISEYWSVSIKCFATTWVDDVIVRVGSSEDATWASGNTAYFDKDPGTVIVEHWGLSSALTTQGTCFPLVNTYGVPLPGPYGILRIRNDNASALVDLVILSVKCK